MSDNGLTRPHTIYDILLRGGLHSIKEIEEETGYDETGIRSAVGQLRKQCNKGNKEIRWIFATGKGFTLDASQSNIIQDANRRMKSSTGVVLNALPVFSKAKKIASSQLAGLKVQHKNAFIKIGNII